MISQEIISFQKKAMAKSLGGIQKAIISLTRDIIYDTPVDTGRLRNNWIPSINQGANYSMLGTDKSIRTSKSRPVFEEAKRSVLTLKLGDTFYFTNNLPYAKVVEFGEYQQSNTGKVVGGFSAKAPKGMVRVNLMKWEKYFA